MFNLSDQRIVFELNLSFNGASCILLEISLTDNTKVVFCLPFICKHKYRKMMHASIANESASECSKTGL